LRGERPVRSADEKRPNTDPTSVPLVLYVSRKAISLLPELDVHVTVAFVFPDVREPLAPRMVRVGINGSPTVEVKVHTCLAIWRYDGGSARDVSEKPGAYSRLTRKPSINPTNPGLTGCLPKRKSVSAPTPRIPAPAAA
jgi:hypothetical protein